MKTIHRTCLALNDDLKDLTTPNGKQPGDPGTDASPFLPEPFTVQQILRMPLRLRVPWIKSILKEDP